MRERAPPTASRIAISFCRADPNASIMLARLRHEVSSTAAASPCSMRIGTHNCVSSCGLVLMLEAAERPDDQILVLVLGRIGLLVRGGDHLQLRVGLLRASTPGFSRPTTISERLRRSEMRKSLARVEVALDRIVHAERHEVLGADDRGGAAEAFRRDADDARSPGR